MMPSSSAVDWVCGYRLETMAKLIALGLLEVAAPRPAGQTELIGGEATVSIARQRVVLTDPRPLASRATLAAPVERVGLRKLDRDRRRFAGTRSSSPSMTDG